MKLGVICQSCGLEAPSKHVEFHQNIGALIMRFHSKVHGNLCKRCVHKKFWSMTGVTLAVGWLGMISLIIAPIFVLNNIIRYVAALGMPPVPDGARAPMINEESFSRFLHHSEEFYLRVRNGEDPSEAARALAPIMNLTPGQVLKCVVTLAQHQKMQQRSPTGGFPVIMSKHSVPNQSASPSLPPALVPQA